MSILLTTQVVYPCRPIEADNSLLNTGSALSTYLNTSTSKLHIVQYLYKCSFRRHIDWISWKYQPFQCGNRLYTSESDVCRRQILTYKDGPRTERIKIFIMNIDH